MLLDIAIVLLFISLCISFYAIYNLLGKVEAYEDAIEEYSTAIDIQTKYLQDISNTITIGRDHINKIDERGIFQADDEVGTFFEAIKVIQDNLNKYAQEVDNAEKKEE
jgi:hypothetical protein